MIKVFTDNYQAIPMPVRKFLLKAAIVFISWNAIYFFILRPGEIPDIPLTSFTSEVGLNVLNYFSATDFFQIPIEGGILFTTADRNIVRVMHACNALELYVLYISFLFCYPTNVKRRILFGFLGVLIIFILNICRIAGVAHLNSIQSEWTDINHKFVFKGIIYSVILYMWYIYAEQKKKNSIE